MPTITASVEQEKTFVIWKGASRPFRKINKEAMTVPSVVAILLAVIFLAAGEWMLIVLVGAFVFAYYMWSTVAPEEAEYSLTSRGIRMHGRLYEWSMMTRWWDEERWGGRYVMIESWASPTGRLFIPIPAKEGKEILGVLEKKLLKEKPPETSVDRMGKWVAEKFPLEMTKK